MTGWVSQNDSYLMEEIIHKMVLFNNNSCVPIIIFPTLKWKNMKCEILVLKIFTEAPTVNWKTRAAGYLHDLSSLRAVRSPPPTKAVTFTRPQSGQAHTANQPGEAATSGGNNGWIFENWAPENRSFILTECVHVTQTRFIFHKWICLPCTLSIQIRNTDTTSQIF